MNEEALRALQEENEEAAAATNKETTDYVQSSSPVNV